MPAFIPDIPYHIQAIFIVTMTYIWTRAFTNDPNYNDPVPTAETEATDLVRMNVYQSLISIFVFMTAFAYLNPYIETNINKW